MTLTFKFNCACRLCGTEFDPAAPAGAIAPGGFEHHYPNDGRIRLPRVARRYLLPFVCDGCWHGFSRWMAAKELAQHRRDAQKHYAGLRHNIRDRDAEQTSRKYQRFSQELLAEWLADGLKTLAQIELRDRLIGIATDAAEKRAERARKYFGRSGKAHSRNWSRYAPDHTPSWAKWEEHT
jgi:hypothetical protein